MNVNYQKVMEGTLAELTKVGAVPSILLHSCCAPCSSACLERLHQHFKITVFYYNPNIAPAEEYERRVKEQERFLKDYPAKYPLSFLEGAYDTDRFYAMAEGKEECPEGGERCEGCFRLRLFETGRVAKEKGFDFFTTTLSLSPLKNAALLNRIGEEASKEYGVPYLFSDFKKKDGFLRSTQLSEEYGLYRQDYCGCVFSRRERDERLRERQNI